MIEIAIIGTSPPCECDFAKSTSPLKILLNFKMRMWAFDPDLAVVLFKIGALRTYISTVHVLQEQYRCSWTSHFLLF